MKPAAAHYVMKDKSGQILDNGKYLSISEKKCGKWRYVRDTWNSDGPPAPAESAAPSKKQRQRRPSSDSGPSSP